MSPYLLTPLARSDIFAIWAYIAEHNETAADRVEQAIYAACEFVASSPGVGRLRPTITSRPLRFWTLTRFRNYSIVYRPDTSPLQIIAVLHGKRDIPATLESRH